eukprot:508785-Pleurochrysis_carterae.AAC.1
MSIGMAVVAISSLVSISQCEARQEICKDSGIRDLVPKFTVLLRTLFKQRIKLYIYECVVSSCGVSSVPLLPPPLFLVLPRWATNTPLTGYQIAQHTTIFAILFVLHEKKSQIIFTSELYRRALKHTTPLRGKPSFPWANLCHLPAVLMSQHGGRLVSLMLSNSQLYVPT